MVCPIRVIKFSVIKVINSAGVLGPSSLSKSRAISRVESKVRNRELMILFLVNQIRIETISCGSQLGAKLTPLNEISTPSSRGVALGRVSSLSKAAITIGFN